MPVFRNRTVLEVAKVIKAFLNLEVGLTRGAMPEPAKRPSVKARLASSALNARTGGIGPGSIVWIFGTERSGSTWLSSMMGEIGGHEVWNEPLVGQLLGNFYAQAPPSQMNCKHFIFSDTTREAYLEGIRYLVLNVARSKFRMLAEGDYLMVKEPNGSVGAPLLMEALPESRVIFLVRDPRDVAASALDRHRKGGLAHQRRSMDARSQGNVAPDSRADRQPNAFVRGQAHRYLKNMTQAKRAYETHEGRKTLVRYEDLRAETLGIMRRLYVELGIPVDEEELARAVEKHAWENIPEEEKGPGKNRRKATPGGWRGTSRQSRSR